MDESKNVLKEVIEHLKSIFDPHLPSIDSLLGQIEIIEWRGLKAVRKRFSSEIGLIKWLPPSLLYKSSYPFAILPAERFKRELNFFSLGDGSWYKVPRIYEVNGEELVIIREYVYGRTLTYDLSTCKLLAKVLAEVHLKGLVLGDVKQSNFLLNNDVIYIIDAEQAITAPSAELAGWDLMLTLLFASYKYVIDSRSFKEFVENFLREYLDSGGLRVGVESMLSVRNLSIALLMPLYNLAAITDIVHKII